MAFAESWPQSMQSRRAFPHMAYFGPTVWNFHVIRAYGGELAVVPGTCLREPSPDLRLDRSRSPGTHWLPEFPGTLSWPFKDLGGFPAEIERTL